MFGFTPPTCEPFIREMGANDTEPDVGPYDPRSDVVKFPGEILDEVSTSDLRVGLAPLNATLPGVSLFWEPMLRALGEAERFFHDEENGDHAVGGMTHSSTAMRLVDEFMLERGAIDRVALDAIAEWPGLAWREYMRWELAECGPNRGCPEDPLRPGVRSDSAAFPGASPVDALDFTVGALPAERPPWWPGLTASSTVTRVYGTVEAPAGDEIGGPGLRVTAGNGDRAWAWMEGPDGPDDPAIATASTSAPRSGESDRFFDGAVADFGQPRIVTEIDNLRGDVLSNVDAIYPPENALCIRFLGDPFYALFDDPDLEGVGRCWDASELTPLSGTGGLLGLEAEVVNWNWFSSPTRPIHQRRVEQSITILWSLEITIALVRGRAMRGPGV